MIDLRVAGVRGNRGQGGKIGMGQVISESIYNGNLSGSRAAYVLTT